MGYRIDAPCEADWNEMTPNRQGRHCALCNKTVVDGTRITEKEVDRLFEADPDLCVQFVVDAEGYAKFPRAPRRRSAGGLILVSALLSGGCGTSSTPERAVDGASAAHEAPEGEPVPELHTEGTPTSVSVTCGTSETPEGEHASPNEGPSDADSEDDVHDASAESASLVEVEGTPQLRLIRRGRRLRRTTGSPMRVRSE